MAQSVSTSVPHTGTPRLLRLLEGSSAFANSARVWLGLVAFLGVVDLFITFVGAGLERDPRSTLFSWPVIAIVGLVGLAGIWLSHRTGFPAAWDGRISDRQRFVIPAVLGIGLGLLQSG